MGQEHRPERRMGDFMLTTRQFGQEYLEPKGPQDWRDISPKNPHSRRSGPDDMDMEFARLPKKPKPTRPIGNTRVN